MLTKKLSDCNLHKNCYYFCNPYCCLNTHSAEARAGSFPFLQHERELWTPLLEGDDRMAFESPALSFLSPFLSHDLGALIWEPWDGVGPFDTPNTPWNIIQEGWLLGLFWEPFWEVPGVGRWGELRLLPITPLSGLQYLWSPFPNLGWRSIWDPYILDHFHSFLSSKSPV